MIGIDIGFGDVKTVMSDGRLVKFPSAVAPVTSSGDDFFSEKDIYEFQGKKYAVGQTALLRKNCFATRDEEFIARYAPLLIYRVVSDLADKPEKIATGLPLTVYLNRTVRERFKEKLKKISVNGETLEFEIYVFAQGQGIFCDYALDGSGRPFPERINDTALVLDIGFNTVDVLSVIDGYPTREGSTTLEGDGVSKICERLADYLQEKFSFTLREQAVKDVLAKKKLRIYGAEKDISVAVNEIVSEYTEWLLQEIYSRWDSFLKQADRLIIAGGGAYYLQDCLPEKYRGFVFIPEKPEFSNARGFLKFLKAKMCQG